MKKSVIIHQMIWVICWRNWDQTFSMQRVIFCFGLQLNLSSRRTDYVCGGCGTPLSTPHNSCVVLIMECHNSHNHSQTSLTTSLSVIVLHITAFVKPHLFLHDWYSTILCTAVKICYWSGDVCKWTNAY